MVVRVDMAQMMMLVMPNMEEQEVVERGQHPEVTMVMMAAVQSTVLVVVVLVIGTVNMAVEVALGLVTLRVEEVLVETLGL